MKVAILTSERATFFDEAGLKAFLKAHGLDPDKPIKKDYSAYDDVFVYSQAEEEG